MKKEKENKSIVTRMIICILICFLLLGVIAVLQNIYTTPVATDAKNKKTKNTKFQASEGYGQVRYTISYYKNSFKYSKKTKHTYIKTKMTWKWSAPPKIKLTDIPYMSTSERFVKASAYSKITYRSYGSLTKSKEVVLSNPVKTPLGGEGVYTKVDMDKCISGKMYYASSGYIVATWEIDQNINSVGLAANYGHSFLSFSPSISFFEGSVSLSRFILGAFQVLCKH